MIKLCFHHKCCVFSLLLFFFLISASTVYGQRQTVKKTDSGLHYLEYLPDSYHTGSEKLPVIIFLHGKGERGNGAAAIHLVKRLGPPKHIENGHNMRFQAQGRSHSFVVISPQLPLSKANWDPVVVDGVVNHVLKHYKIDPDRVYLTGLSLGGGGCWYYAVSSYNKPNKIAAIAPVAGFLSESKSKKDTRFLADNKVGVWAFHNTGDKIIPLSMGKAPVDGLKSHHPVVAPRFTVYNTGGHDAWTNAYQTSHAVHTPNLYEWLLLHKRGKAPSGLPVAPENKMPVAKAGADQQIQLPKNHTVLDGRQSRDEDGSVARYFWKKLSGPAATIESTTASYTRVGNLQKGTYVFELSVTDNQGAASKDELVLQVSSAVMADKDKEDTEPEAEVGGEQGLHYTLYHGSWSKVADISSGQLMKQGIVPNFTLSPRKRDSYFGFEFSGYISIQKEGNYTFYLTSDEGSKLWIDKREVVNNDGKHTLQERSGSIFLPAGLHPVRVLFFERSQQDILQVEYAGPGMSRRTIPDQVLYTDKQGGQQASSSAAASRVNFKQLSAHSSYKGAEEAPESERPEEGSLRVQAYPNPLQAKLLLDVSGAKEKVVTIRLTDMLGQVLYTEQRAIGSHTETIVLELEDLPGGPGLLLLQVGIPGQPLQLLKLLRE